LIKFYSYFILFLNYFTTITKQVIQLLLFMLVGIDVCVMNGLRVGGNQSARRETHLSDLVTTWP